MAKKTYSVKSPIKYDGEDYEVGDSIDLDEKEAKDLLAVKALGEADGAAGNTPSAPTDEDERIAAIVDAIGKLDKKETASWTKGNSPQIPALQAITGWVVTGKDRDAAWEKVQAAE